MSQILEVEVGEVVVVVARDLILHYRTGLESCQSFPLRKGMGVSLGLSWIELYKRDRLAWLWCFGVGRSWSVGLSWV
jgi:hypothetical protein